MNKTPESIHLEEKALRRALGTGHFMNTVVMINGQRTLPKDVAFHPVTDRPLHVDFLRISEHATVHVNVPVHFVDEDESVYARKGGVLNVVRHEIELVCDASEIPSEITVSLKGREIGDSIHIGDVTLPKGVKPATEDDFTVATIVPPTVPTAEDEAADAEVAEAQAAEAAAETEGEAADGDAAAEGEAKSEDGAEG